MTTTRTHRNVKSFGATNLRDAGSNWILGTVDGLQVQAKAYVEPSSFGMSEDARISKLHVVDGGVVVYSYDRGLEVDDLPAERLSSIVSAVAKKIK